MSRLQVIARAKLTHNASTIGIGRAVDNEKHVNWFALEKACEKEGCPVCGIINERAERYIDNMLFEHVSDRGFRAKYRASGGFCDRHAANLESFRDGLAVAILGVDVLTTILPELSENAYRASRVCVRPARKQPG